MRGNLIPFRVWFVVAAVLSASASGCVLHRAEIVPIPNPGAVPSELDMVSLPPYVIGPPDILLIDVLLPPADVLSPPVGLVPQRIEGQHLVQPDGTVRLGIWGSVPVSGLTLDQAAEAVRQHVFEKINKNSAIRKQLDDAAKEKDPKKDKPIQLIDNPEKLLVAVAVFAYNSKTYYIITDGAGYGEQIYSFPITGNDTVLSALANINGLPQVASKRNIWIARRTPHTGSPEQILWVDYVGTTQHGVTNTNYQMFPGDRLYVRSQKIFRVDSFMQKALTPIERLLGVTLLGSSTVNSISGRTQNTTPR